MTTDQLLASRAANAITEKDFIRNQNINDLITLAMEDNDDFLELSFREQLQIINGIIEAEYMHNVATIPTEDVREVSE